jgi:hypothetical protein
MDQVEVVTFPRSYGRHVHSHLQPEELREVVAHIDVQLN